MFQKNKKLHIFLFLIIFFLNYNNTFAADINFSTDSKSYNVGDILRVKVYVSSKEGINAISGKIYFSNNILVLNSLSVDSSIVNIWPHEPSFSNTDGIISFEGVILNGYKGSSGKIITLVFKAKSKGEAVFKLSDISILANDGKGTDVFSGNLPSSNILIEDIENKVLTKNLIQNTTSNIEVKDNFSEKTIKNNNISKCNIFPCYFFWIILVLIILILILLLIIFIQYRKPKHINNNN